MTDVVPTLSTAGFVSDVPSMIDRMLAYYLTSDFSQSNVFFGQVVSLQKQMQQYQHDPLTLQTRIREELTGYFGGAFDSVTVNVSTEIPNPDDPNRINVTVEAVIVKDGKSYSVGKLIETQNSITQKIINLNNEGVSA